MDALIEYGSLINKSELRKGGFPLDITRPLVIRRFKRVFCQEPSWRPDRGEQRAVLNINRFRAALAECFADFRPKRQVLGRRR